MSKATIKLNLTDDEVVAWMQDIPLSEWLIQYSSETLREGGKMVVYYWDERTRKDRQKTVSIKKLRTSLDAIALANLWHCGGYSITGDLLGPAGAACCVGSLALQHAIFNSTDYEA